MFYWSLSATLANVLKSSATKLAPPINAPSIFGFFINSSILFSFTLPPYWIRIASAVALSYNDATVALINPHVSSATSAVAVLPVVEDVEIEINPADIKMEVFRASGAGGQHVNKTSSAVRLIHVPTGIVAECQTERSQLQNREYAMKLLRSRLYEIEKTKQDNALANERKSQIGSGDRSEKIRTYNYPQGRITDHRIGLSIFQMEDFLNGNLDNMIDSLTAAHMAEKLKGNEEE